MPELAMRLRCQCCDRLLVPRADGTSRRHGRGGSCPGSGYRLPLWDDGQRLAHYTGQVWEVVGHHLNAEFGIQDYTMRCVVQTVEISNPVDTVRAFHAEYLHRHGWKPLPCDLMTALERSLAAVRRADDAEVSR